MERLGWGIGSDRTDSSTVCVCVCVFGKGGGVMWLEIVIIF